MVGRRRAGAGRRGWGGAALSAAIVLATVLWHPGEGAGPFGALEGRLIDARFALRGPLPPPGGVAVVLIDDADIAGMGRFPPPRPALAEAVGLAFAAGATGVAVDLLLVDEADGDGALAGALAGGAPVVLGVARGTAPAAPALSAAIARSSFDVAIDAPALTVSSPLGPAAALARFARLGHVNVAPDPDAALRRLPAAVALAGPEAATWVPGLAPAVLRAARPDRFAPLILRGPGAGGTIALGGHAVPLDRFGAIPLVFYGPAGTVPTVPLRDLATADLWGRVAFLGISAMGAEDLHPSPFDRALPGVEAHATLAANIIEGRHLRRDGAAWLLTGLLAVAVAGAAHVAARATPVRAALGLAAIALAAAGALQTAFAAGWWLDATTVLLALALVAATGLASGFFRTARRAETLAGYQAPSLRAHLADGTLSGLDSRALNAAVLFVDLAGFTGESERVGPDGTADMLSTFHARIARAAEAHGGVVDQIVGDAAMVTFGLPDPGPRDAANALAVAAELLGAGQGAALRIGAHFGPVEARVLGGADHRHLTIAGDAVNAASRLQEAAREANASLAVSDILLQQTGTARHWIEALGLRDLGLLSLRGRRLKLHVWAGSGRG